jgi:hypothetical protein
MDDKTSRLGAAVLIALLALLGSIAIAAFFFINKGILDPQVTVISFTYVVFWLLRYALGLIFAVTK